MGTTARRLVVDGRCALAIPYTPAAARAIPAMPHVTPMGP